MALLLSGCESLPLLKPVTDPHAAWRQHRQDLSKFSHWTIHGRISIRADEDAWHAAIIWKQQPRQFDIRFIAPLGSGNVQLVGDGQMVVLHSPEQKALVDTDAENLLYRHLGWRVPLSGIRYWAIGLPEPEIPAKQTLDDQGRLASLLQSGWDIDFRRYRRVGKTWLPDKIFMKNQQLDVRLVIDRWEMAANLGS